MLGALGDGPSIVQAQSGNTRFVAPNGNDCASVGYPCRTVQRAVDWADDGDEIRVLSVPTPISACVPALNHDYWLVTQVVYISKTMTIRGRYTTTNWTMPDGQNNPTTLDAQRQGRVMLIAGDISPTIEGPQITLGDATPLGGSLRWGSIWDAGAGV